MKNLFILSIDVSSHKEPPMRFGMFDILRWHKDWTAERAFDASLEQIEYADKLGLQDIWLGEHHFSRELDEHNDAKYFYLKGVAG